mgnify:CR=1 FL=1
MSYHRGIRPGMETVPPYVLCDVCRLRFEVRKTGLPEWFPDFQEAPPGWLMVAYIGAGVRRDYCPEHRVSK